MTEAMKIIKVIPYQGQDSEIYEGKPTRISLFDDRLEYKMKFTQKVNITFIKDGEATNNQEADNFCDEEGFLLKSAITGVSKYIETEYHKTTGEPINVNYVDVGYKGSVFTFSCSKVEEKDNLYRTIYNWYLNITE